MSSIIEHRWALPEVDTVFELVFAMELGVALDGHRVAVTCRWPPVETKFVTLHAARATPISLDFGCGYKLRGTMEVIRDNDRRTPSVGVYADLAYDWRGRPPIQHFQGLVFLRKEPTPPAPPPPEPPSPPPPPAPPPDDADADAVPVITPHDEVFPYVYVRPWPKIPAEDLEYGFFSYADPSPPGASFIAALGARVPQGRAAMEMLARAFVDGATPWQGQYIVSRASLDGPVRDFARLALQLQHPARDDWTEQLCRDLRHVLERHGKTGAWLLGADYAATLDRVWQSYFALAVLLGYDQPLLGDLTLTLWLANAAAKALVVDEAGHLRVGALTAEQYEAVAHASALLPSGIFPLPPAVSASPPASCTRGWVEPYAVGDLQMVRQRLLRYAAGEIARIENIMRGERREVSSRQGRLRLDVEHTAGEEVAILQSDDTDARISLLEETSRTEIGKTIGTIYDNFTTSYGPPTQATVSGTMNRVTTAGSPGGDDVTRFAREIIGKAVNSISRNVNTVRATTSLSQVEDAVVSLIDNTHGSANLSAVYRWVNKIYEACVVNYGNRLIMEFVVQPPAADFGDASTADAHRPNAPFPPPATMGVRSFDDITPLNYARLCAAYGVTDIAPPPGPKFASASVRSGDETQVALPPGYCACAAAAGCASTLANPLPMIMIGCQPVALNGPIVALAPRGEASAIPVSVAAVASSRSPPDFPEIVVNIEIECAPTPRNTDEWRIQIYAAIIKAYEQSTERRLAAVAEGTFPAPKMSPLAWAKLTRHALKRDCIEVLLERAALLTDAGGRPSLSPPAAEVDRPRALQFLDEALEWSEMTYTFQHDRPGGGDRDETGSDPHLASFLHADRARVLLPVRPEHVLAFLYFFAAGMIWDGPDGLVAVNIGDLHIVDDLKRAARRPERERRVGHPWQVVVPTAMQVLDTANLPSAGAAFTVSDGRDTA